MIISDGTIFSRYDSSNNILIKISVSSGSMSFWAHTSDQSFPAAGNNGPSYSITYSNFYIDEWRYITAVSDYPGSQTTETLYIESNYNQVIFTGSYINDGLAYGTNIGCDPACTGGFTGYIYYIIFENNAEYLSSVQNSYSTSCSGCSYCRNSQPCISTCANPRYPDSCSSQCNCANNAIGSCSDSNINVCQICDSSCSRACLGLTSSDCVDIKATYCKQNNPSNPNHPYSPIQKTCLWNVVCPNNCYYCEVDPTCIQCDPGYVVDNTGNCIQCDSSCTTCSGSPTHCLSCSASGYSPSLSNGACQCTTSEYEISSSPLTCGSCHSSCSTCAGSGTNNCNTCADSAIIPVSIPGACSCPSNKYIAQKATLLCKACDSSCSSCSGPSSNDCLTCPNSIVLSSTPNSCTCNSDEYMSILNPKTCSPCHSSCATCSGGLIADCLSCKTSVLMSSSPGQCICASNQYKSQDSPLVCTNCDSACSTCSGPLPTDCTSCPDSSITLSSNPGYCACEISQYIVSKSPFVCGDCNENCYSCSGWGENNCLSCKNSEITPSSDGYCKCKDNEYIISMTSLQCGACDSSCNSCAGPDPSQCLTCKDSSVALQVQPSSCSSSTNENSSKSKNDLKGYAKIGGYLAAGGLVAAGFLMSVIEGKTGTLWTYVNIVQLLAFIPLQNIAIPGNLYEFWKAFLSYTKMPSLGKLIYGEDGADDVTPYSNWVKYGYTGSSFLVNGGGMFLIALVVITLWIIVYSITFYKKEKVQKIIIPLLSKFKYNAFIRLWLEIYILLMAANIVGINNLLFTSPSAFIDSILSILILLLSIILQIIFFVVVYIIRFKVYRKSKKITAKYGSLFEEFKFSNHYIELLYYPFFLLRRFILVINLYNSSRIPLFQCILNVFHSIAAALYLFKYCHFKEKETHWINLAGELLVAVSFLLTCPYIYDIPSILDDAIQITVISLTFSYLVASYYFLLAKIYATIKAKLKKKTNIAVIPEAVKINESGFNDFKIRIPQKDLLNFRSTAYNSNETILSQRDELKVVDQENI